MEVLQWLEETDNGAQAGRPKQAPLAEPSLRDSPKKKDLDRIKHDFLRRARRRKRSCSDSSILIARQDACSNDEIRYSTASSQLGTASEGRYRRRKRHKTHADKYEYKAKRAGQGKNAAKGVAEQSKRQKISRAKGKGRAEKGIASVVRDFRAENVQRDRLTFRQSAPNVGLFRKGRAGSPFRGRGVPDLIFSEMKFLKKRDRSPEWVAAAGSKESQRHRQRTKLVEEEISGYFAPVRPALAERDGNVRSNSPAHTPTKRTKHRKPEPRHFNHSTSIGRITPPSARGDPVAHKAANAARPEPPNSDAGTYLSWSTSVALRNTGASLSRASGTRGEVDVRDSPAPKPVLDPSRGEHVARDYLVRSRDEQGSQLKGQASQKALARGRKLADDENLDRPATRWSVDPIYASSPPHMPSFRADDLISRPPLPVLNAAWRQAPVSSIVDEPQVPKQNESDDSSSILRRLLRNCDAATAASMHLSDPDSDIDRPADFSDSLVAQPTVRPTVQMTNEMRRGWPRRTGKRPMRAVSSHGNPEPGWRSLRDVSMHVDGPVSEQAQIPVPSDGEAAMWVQWDQPHAELLDHPMLDLEVDEAEQFYPDLQSGLGEQSEPEGMGYKGMRLEGMDNESFFDDSVDALFMEPAFRWRRNVLY